MIYPDINSVSDTLQLKGEVWKPVVGWEGLYSVSNLGRVRRERREVIHRNQVEDFRMVYPEKILKGNCDSKGYPQVRLNGKHFGKKHRVARIHRLVAESFIPNPLRKPHVNHMNSNKLDPRPENLEWCTASENLKHAYESGAKKVKLGENCPNNKYDRDLVSRIYMEAKARTMSQEKIGEKYGVPQITVSNILTKKTWGHVTDLIDREVH